MATHSFLERWSRKGADRRDREFYLVALPLAVLVVGVTPHFMKLALTTGGEKETFILAGLVAAGSAVTGVVCFAATKAFSSGRLWGPARHRWPLSGHILLLWTPVMLLVDLPQRMTELAMIWQGGSWSPAMTTYILGVSMGRTFLFAGGVVFYERLIGAVLEAADHRQRALRLETETLRNLIQPHFLLNSLNVIRAYIEEEPKTAEAMTLRLTSLLRRVIDASSAESLPLQDEMEIVADYVAVMNHRYEAEFALSVDGPVLDISLPPLILFSLVENSFKHGFAGRKEGAIAVTVTPGDRLTLSVVDDGAAPPGEEEDNGNGCDGVGVSYIRNRLELYYGDDYSFTHGALGEGGGYRATVVIPWRQGGERRGA